MTMRSALALSLLLATALHVVEGFLVPVPNHNARCSVVPSPAGSKLYATKSPSSSVPEYSEYSVAEEFVSGDEDELVDNDDVEAGSAKASLAAKPAPTAKVSLAAKPAPTSSSAPKTPKLQYAAMEPGTVVHIQVGDISLARKAWKKRRRSGSPLLVPCSVLTVDRQSTIRWNLIYLLEKFGASHEGGIRISLADLTRRHRKHLQSSLTQHAESMGYETAMELVEALFNKQVQETYGVKLVLGEENADTLWLQAPISRFKAQKRAGKAAVLQFDDDTEDDTLRHTGIVRNRREHTAAPGDSLHYLKPLGAALRVSQADVESGTIQNGSMHAAVLFDYDNAGDAGSPLLTLSLNPGRNQVRDRLKIVDQRQVIRNPKYMLHDIKAGEGPIQGKVVRLIKGAALVDCSFGRRKSNSEDAIKVYGVLQFPDAVKIQSAHSARDFEFVDDEVFDEEVEDDDDDDDWEDIMSSVNDDLDDDDEEEEDAASSTLKAVLKKLDDTDEEFADSEDITHLFNTSEDGSLTYNDPESGESELISREDEEDDDDEKEEAPIRRTPAGFPKSRQSRQRRSDAELVSSSRPLFMHVGDQIEVFVKTVSKQSKQILLTLDSTVQGRKAKDVKKEGELNKKMSRLSKQLGGLHRIDQLRGQHYDGVVKATSNTGDWLYVQPTTAEHEDGLPIGLATVETEVGADLKQGDGVRIQIEGVDEERGQLAFRILHKL